MILGQSSRKKNHASVRGKLEKSRENMKKNKVYTETNDGVKSKQIIKRHSKALYKK